MKFIADLHIHSKYARACSKELTLENIDAWCRIKGINIVSSADFTHPKWFSEIKNKLTSSEHPGLYLVKSKESPTKPPPIPSPKKPTLFLIGTEVACIYSHGGKVRRVHHCIFAPSLEVADKINKAIEGRGGKLASDGRPILGISSEDLLKILLDIDERCVLIPAHIWTPWFAIFGSFSGYDNVQACFGDLAQHIFALETGLSSDPQMNWRKRELDNFALVSSSDAHSLPNLGREANIFEGEPQDLSYDAIMQAIKNSSSAKLSDSSFKPQPPSLKMTGTIEFIPDEGRYHYDGHRACKTSLHPHETKKLGGICPKCKKKVTIGVLSRVEELADLPHDRRPKAHPNFYNLVEFDKLIAEAEGVQSRTSKAVDRQYWEFLKNGGSEIDILLNFNKQKLAEFCPPIVVEAIIRMREGKLAVTPGYDGEYGKIKMFSDSERKKLQQTKLF